MDKKISIFLKVLSFLSLIGGLFCAILFSEVETISGSVYQGYVVTKFSLPLFILYLLFGAVCFVIFYSLARIYELTVANNKMLKNQMGLDDMNNSTQNQTNNMINNQNVNNKKNMS